MRIIFVVIVIRHPGYAADDDHYHYDISTEESAQNLARRSAKPKM